jgi:hypothetical protein
LKAGAEALGVAVILELVPLFLLHQGKSAQLLWLKAKVPRLK